MQYQWDGEADVVVVGFGGAGACAAIEAADEGASVVVLERFNGGGATALSGGVVYAGGGTRYQQAAGINDTPENMFAYLQQEVQGAVSDETLHRFCEESQETITWLEQQGVPFEASLCPFKTSYPTDAYYLYYSGNELSTPYTAYTTPAPRGHRTKGPGTSGKVLFARLADSARRKGVRVYTQAPVQHLLTDDNGQVVGVEYKTISPERQRLLRQLTSMTSKLSFYAPPLAEPLNAWIRSLEASTGTIQRIRARRGVILAAGGFIFDRKMVATYAPNYLRGLPLGTIADDGVGIQLGQEAGGIVTKLDHISAWRFLAPPVSMTRGVLVDDNGQRVCNETWYGDTIGRRIIEKHDGHAWLILDQTLFERVKAEAPGQSSFFQLPQVRFLLALGNKKADTLIELADMVQISRSGLQTTIESYNNAARAGDADSMGKAREYVQPLDRAPFYAIDCSLDASPFFPCATMTLGGLVVDEDSGLVKRADGSTIQGLYAAGRTAAGLCANAYVSGLSIADCIFSGRRAGRHAARSAIANALT